jgi:8-oxo-dGTP diphosphatase
LVNYRALSYRLGKRMVGREQIMAEQSQRPIVATIAVVLREGRVLQVCHANPPDAGRWGFPGGKIEFGETVEQAAVRELYEETAIRGEAMQNFTTFDAFDHGVDASLRRHFVLVAVLCRSSIIILI